MAWRSGGEYGTPYTGMTSGEEIEALADVDGSGFEKWWCLFAS